MRLVSTPIESPLPDWQASELLGSLAVGNTVSFWKIWDLYKEHLYHICLSHMDGVREDAEDALSRSMLRALEKLPEVCGRIENVKAWLCRLTINLCFDMHRERKRRTRRLESIDDVPMSVAESLRASADSPEEVFLSQEALDDVCGAVNDLPARLREPFALRFFDEMPYDEIADLLILSNANVRKRIQQARDILKDRFSQRVAAERLLSEGVGRRLGGVFSGGSGCRTRDTAGLSGVARDRKSTRRR